MTIEEDTRQKPGKHANLDAYFKKIGVTVIRQQLLVGDYTLANDHSISIDTKSDVRELAMDIYQEHERFRNECQRAQDAGILLIVLIEQVLPDGRLSNWQPPAGCGVNPDRLRKSMITMMQRYGVRFEFCDARSTGKRLIELLATRGRW